MKKDFILAGRAIFTLEVPPAYQLSLEAKPHYTFRVKFKKATVDWPDTYFVNLLTGPDNTKDYTYLGLLDKDTGKVRLTSKSCVSASDVSYKLLTRALDRVWKDEYPLLEKHGFVLHHEGRCGRCGRVLTVPESCQNGIGPECLKYFRPIPKVAHGESVEDPNWIRLKKELEEKQALETLKH